MSQQTIVADENNDRVQQFCKKILGHIPTFYRLQIPKEGRILNCFPNVLEHVEKNGGEIQYGWSIWQVADIMLDAEFHAVWRSPENELIDLTPIEGFIFPHLLFICDNQRKYQGRKVFNLRTPLSKNPIAKDYIKASDAYDKATARITRDFEYGEKVVISVGDPRISNIYRKKETAFKMLLAGQKEKDECMCKFTRGIKYKNCCGKIRIP